MIMQLLFNTETKDNNLVVTALINQLVPSLKLTRFMFGQKPEFALSDSRVGLA